MKKFPNTENIHYFSGNRGFKNIEKVEPDLILLGFMMKDLNDGKFIEEIKNLEVLGAKSVI